MKNIRRLIIVMTLAVMAMIMMTAASFAETKVVADGGDYEFQYTDIFASYNLDAYYVTLEQMPTEMQLVSDDYTSLVGFNETTYTVPVGKNDIIACLDADNMSDYVGKIATASDSVYVLYDASTYTTYFIVIGKAPVEPPELSEDGYYQITNAEQLGWFRDTVNAGEDEINARLMNDIDMSEVTEWTPIANNNRTSLFYGIFDGNGKTIKNINWTFTTATGGLFGYNYGTVKNLTTEGDITASAMYVAPVVSRNYGIIVGCINKVSITSSGRFFSGIASTNFADGVIVNCANLGGIEYTGGATNGATGGLVGTCAGTVINSYNSGDITFNGGVAGGIICNFNATAIVKNCYNSGSLTLNGSGTPGKLFGTVAAGATQTLVNCYALSSDPTPLCGSDTAGVVAGIEGGAFEVATINASDLGNAFEDDTNNINNGYPVLPYQNGKDYPEAESADGLEIIDAEIKTHINDSTLILTINKEYEYYKVPQSIISGTYSIAGDEEATNLTFAGNSLVIDGNKITLKFQSLLNRMTAEEQDLTISVSLNGTESVEKQCKLMQSPYQSNYVSEPQKIAKGDKDWPEFIGYYKISTPEELAWFAGLVNGELEGVPQKKQACAFLANDIVCNDTEGWEDWDQNTVGLRMWDCTIGKAGSTVDNIPEIQFNGVFDGNGYAIRGLYLLPDITRENYRNLADAGLFPVLYNATIKNLGVEESLILFEGNNTGSRLGGIAGIMTRSTAENCWFTGKLVSNANITGGIVGRATVLSHINGCYTALPADSAGGGISGQAWAGAKFEDCYTIGRAITIGVSDPVFYRCYSTANVYIAPTSLPEDNLVNCFCLDGPITDTRVNRLTEDEFTDGTLLARLDSAAYCADDPGEAAKNNGMPILAWQSDAYKAKKAAIKEIKYYLDPSEYTFSQAELDAALETAIANIEAASTVADVNEYKQAAIAVLDEFKTNAEIAGESNADIERLKTELDEVISKIEMQGATVEVAKTSVVANGKAQTPAVTVTGKSGAVLEEGKDYTVAYKDNVNPGLATVTVTGTGDTDPAVKTATFKILPKKATLKKVKPAKKKLTITWAKDNTVTGYEVQYSLKKNFKGVKKIDIKKAGTAKTTVKKLKSGGKYFVRVRSYKTVGKDKLYGAWSKVKNAKVK